MPNYDKIDLRFIQFFKVHFVFFLRFSVSPLLRGFEQNFFLFANKKKFFFKIHIKFLPHMVNFDFQALLTGQFVSFEM